jgi:hypothetical protein
MPKLTKAWSRLSYEEYMDMQRWVRTSFPESAPLAVEFALINLRIQFNRRKEDESRHFRLNEKRCSDQPTVTVVAEKPRSRSWLLAVVRSAR